MATPDPSNVAPWYLRNINQALALDETSGNVYLRTGITGDIIIEGNVNIPGNIDAHISEIGTSGNLTVPWMPVSLDGNSNVTVTSGNITVAQGTSPWTVSGTVNIGTMPEVEIKNDVGNAIPVSWQYGSGASIIPWEVQVARGKISGVTGLSISGYSADVGTSWVPIWHTNTAYTYFPSAQQVRVWSDSASDTNLSIQVNGLDASYNLLSETVLLNNGVTGVLTTGNFLRVNSIIITADPTNVGNISAGNSGKTIILSSIAAGAGRSQQTTYTVPAGYTFYLTQVNVYTNQVGSQTGLYRSWTKSFAGVINIILTFPFVDQYNSRKVVPRAYPEKTDIQWQAQSSQGTSRVGAQIEGYLIANSVA